MKAQLGFCEGNSGDPIFEEDFGQGTSNGPPLPPGVTNYTFVNQGAEDGQYTISSSLFQLSTFHNTGDHTGNVNGKALIVNADFDPGLFYQIPISGLCINNSYEFSAFLMNIYNTSTNVCPNNGIPVNVKFQIWDETDTTLLAEGDTGPIAGTSSPQWRQFALTFTTLSGQNSVILKMLNNGQGGCGNDLAIDDIVFKSCGDLTEITSDAGESQLVVCEDETVSNLTLNADPDFSIYNSPVYQWQQSSDNENWIIINGETSNQLDITTLNSTTYYRTLVAEDSSNLTNTACNSISSVFEVKFINYIDPISLGNVTTCENDYQGIKVQSNSNIEVNWYDEPTGGNLLAENTFEFEPEANGIYYAEAVTMEGNCVNPNRVAIQFKIGEVPELFDETLQKCTDEQIILGENLSSNNSYSWSTGETSQFIQVTDEGTYTLQLTTPDDCVVSKTYTIENIESPSISELYKENNSLFVETENQGDFSYSLDGINFQQTPRFDNLSGGLYTIYVRENSGCGIVTEEYLYINIPEFFSPNADQINDRFKIEGDIYFEYFEVYIFDRYGKLLIKSENTPFEWDGTYNGKALPSDDYWYRIIINNDVYKGNFTLIR